MKTKKNNTYNYTPRYYDERKERLQEIKNMHRVISDEEYAAGHRRNPSVLRETNLYQRPNRRSNSNMRLVLIIGILTLIAYIAVGSFDLASILK